MTFDDDFCEFHSPEIIDFYDAPGMRNPKFRQVSRSKLTDKEKLAAPNVMRGALYYPAELRH